MEREVYTPYGKIEIAGEEQLDFLDWLVELYEQSGSTQEEAVEKAYETFKEYGQMGF